eukprot:COSAG04_NODE_6611_length_1293_cov_2.268844_1_plen_105_part_00
MPYEYSYEYRTVPAESARNSESDAKKKKSALALSCGAPRPLVALTMVAKLAGKARPETAVYAWAAMGWRVPPVQWREVCESAAQRSPLPGRREGREGGGVVGAD